MDNLVANNKNDKVAYEVFAYGHLQTFTATYTAKYDGGFLMVTHGTDGNSVTVNGFTPPTGKYDPGYTNVAQYWTCPIRKGDTIKVTIKNPVNYIILNCNSSIRVSFNQSQYRTAVSNTISSIPSDRYILGMISERGSTTYSQKIGDLNVSTSGTTAEYLMNWIQSDNYNGAKIVLYKTNATSSLTLNASSTGSTANRYVFQAWF